MDWFDVDETGHVPGVAAELPQGYQVLLDGQGQLCDMRLAPLPVTTVQPLEPSSEQEQASEQQQLGG